MGWKQFQPFKMFIYTEDKNNKQNMSYILRRRTLSPIFWNVMQTNGMCSKITKITFLS